MTRRPPNSSAISYYPINNSLSHRYVSPRRSSIALHLRGKNQYLEIRTEYEYSYWLKFWMCFTRLHIEIWMNELNWERVYYTYQFKRQLFSLWKDHKKLIIKIHLRFQGLLLSWYTFRGKNIKESWNRGWSKISEINSLFFIITFFWFWEEILFFTQLQK